MTFSETVGKFVGNRWEITSYELMTKKGHHKYLADRNGNRLVGKGKIGKIFHGLYKIFENRGEI